MMAWWKKTTFSTILRSLSAMASLQGNNSFGMSRPPWAPTGAKKATLGLQRAYLRLSPHGVLMVCVELEGSRDWLELNQGTYHNPPIISRAGTGTQKPKNPTRNCHYPTRPEQEILALGKTRPDPTRNPTPNPRVPDFGKKIQFQDIILKFNQIIVLNSLPESNPKPEDQNPKPEKEN